MSEDDQVVDQPEPTAVGQVLRGIGPWQVLVSGAAVLSLYVLGLVFIYLDLVYERLGAAGAQPSLPQADLWPRALFWGGLHLFGVGGVIWSFGLARYAQGTTRGLGAFFGAVLFAYFLATGGIRLPSIRIVVLLFALWPAATLVGALTRGVRRTKVAKDDDELSPADARRVLGLAFGLILSLVGGLVAQQASSTVTAIRADRRPDNFFMILPVRKVNVTFTDDSVAQGLSLPADTPTAATLLGQRDGRLTLLVLSGRRVIDVPSEAAVLASRT